MSHELSMDEEFKTLSAKPSIAILALKNMNRDPDLDFIGDGITEDLITALSKIRSFEIIFRESTFSYKDSAIDVRQVAKELSVQYVLEGSVRKAGRFARSRYRTAHRCGNRSPRMGRAL